jgi:hypothetical protein
MKQLSTIFGLVTVAGTCESWARFGNAGSPAQGSTLTRELRRAGRRKRRLTATAVLLALLEVWANGSLALAQTGSTGGSIGKTGKSVTGGDEPERSYPARSTARHRETVRVSTCSKLLGVWKGALGGDITYKSGGAVTSTIPVNEGRWSCGNTGIIVTWTKIPSADHCTLSSNGMLQTCTNNAGNSFVRSRKS